MVPTMSSSGCGGHPGGVRFRGTVLHLPFHGRVGVVGAEDTGADRAAEVTAEGRVHGVDAVERIADSGPHRRAGPLGRCAGLAGAAWTSFDPAAALGLLMAVGAMFLFALSTWVFSLTDIGSK